MSPDVFNLPVFPAADVFPMMADDELQELAADIAENGLREPVVVAEIANDDGVLVPTLIDGRNRRAACEIAGIMPETRMLNGEDPTAFAVSANVHRRHMTKGQRAMAVAMIYPHGQQGKKSTSSIPDVVAPSYVRMARTVLAASFTKAAEILAGTLSLDAAYQAVQAEKRVTDERDNLRERLEKHAPDLAQRVSDEELKLEEADVLYKQRDQENRSRRHSLFMGLREARSHLRGFIASDMLPELPKLLKSEEYRDEFTEVFQGKPKELKAMIAEMEAEIAALKSIVEKIDV